MWGNPHIATERLHLVAGFMVPRGIKPFSSCNSNMYSPEVGLTLYIVAIVSLALIIVGKLQGATLADDKRGVLSLGLYLLMMSTLLIGLYIVKAIWNNFF
ncbi:MAG: hypothetical protein A2915_00765 [Candidatus Yanofskybacteria bacterium RIFCSPLOWO2_01_FULL_41_34]|uniref:Uncharacterized protein n=1 Tax=Candidatus Yanofskybacteria bacterium RIFCSPHIGHO2_01_FULL_41_26 TaxID=1802661 RepID=A0A1F8EDP6_9BACT|nr:MAG: hypothetical protein A2649_02795 [Candidatus Yanofskybacteria bacterium RIFCSPHIGHO2_01_FULL_41_26]OGN22427.1 MAG: hypothetical protein A2915_00765 [Candidatus Yanofskybacteria bacterium RIFCSPLOWO2_01_FULL_41_34]